MLSLKQDFVFPFLFFFACSLSLNQLTKLKKYAGRQKKRLLITSKFILVQKREDHTVTMCHQLSLVKYFLTSCWWYGRIRECLVLSKSILHVYLFLSPCMSLLI